MRKLLVLAALVAGGLGLGASGGAIADTLPGGIEGCVASNPGTTGPTALYADTCSYTATRTGGFVGGGQSWKVTVYDNDSATKVVIGSYSGSGPACNIASTKPGNLVVVTVTNGMVAAGNPIPSATDGSTPPTEDRCP